MTQQDHVWQCCDDILELLAGYGVPTPERTYKMDGGWGLALADTKRYIDTLRAQLAAAKENNDRDLAEMRRFQGMVIKLTHEAAAATARAEKAEKALAEIAELSGRECKHEDYESMADFYSNITDRVNGIACRFVVKEAL